ncbi:MAG: hypothetical protein JO112_10065 [Planctomycetes bacterium]|nr:hypothetical protein [Planctomycetota bacterium]
MIALTASGQVDALTAAQDMGNALLATLNPDGSHWSEMWSGHALQGDGNPRPLIAQNRTLGDEAFLGLAFLDLFETTGDGRFLKAAQGLSDWAEQLRDTANALGGYRGGFDENGNPLLFKSLEANTDLFQLNRRLAALAGPNATADMGRASFAAHFILALFDPVQGRFYVGTATDGTTINTTDLALDTQIYPFLTLAQWPEYANLNAALQRPIAWTVKNLMSTDSSYAGNFAFSTLSTAGAWVEGDVDVAAAEQLLGNTSAAAAILQKVDLIAAAAQPSSAIIPYLPATPDGVTDNSIGAFYDKGVPALAPTAIYVLDRLGMNVFSGPPPTSNVPFPIRVSDSSNSVSTVSELALSANAYGLTNGPDGAIWFTDFGGNKIDRFTPTGVATAYPLDQPVNDNSSRGPSSIIRGPDNNLWFTEGYANQIGKITLTGNPSEVMQTTMASPGSITVGPDGNLWFIEGTNEIGKVTPAGVLTEYPVTLAGATSTSRPLSITTGPDGNLWITGFYTTPIAKVDPATGIVNGLPASVGLQGTLYITTGPDGNLWFTEFGNIPNGVIGRLNPFTGALTEFDLPPGHAANLITAGPDGNLWFVEPFFSDRIGRITSNGVITEFTTPAAAGLISITAGPDGKVWFSENQGSGGGLGWFTSGNEDVLQFGSVPVNGSGSQMATRTITLTNTGQQTLTISQKGITLGSGTQFKITALSSSTQPMLNLASLGNGPATLAGGGTETWTITLQFDPSMAGTWTDTLRIASNDPASNASGSLTTSVALAATSISYPAATALPHQVGRADGNGLSANTFQGSDADGWSANTFQDTAGYLSYGPYTTNVPAGTHTAVFRLLVDNNSYDDAPVAVLDVYSPLTGEELAERVVRRGEFTTPYVYQDFDLEFGSLASQMLEFRVYYIGNSYLRENFVGVA